MGCNRSCQHTRRFQRSSLRGCSWSEDRQNNEAQNGKRRADDNWAAKMSRMAALSGDRQQTRLDPSFESCFAESTIRGLQVKQMTGAERVREYVRVCVSVSSWAREAGKAALYIWQQRWPQCRISDRCATGSYSRLLADNSHDRTRPS